MEFSILIGLGIICVTILAVAEKYFDYKKSLIEENKDKE